MKIKIPKNIVSDCENFATKVIGTNIDKYRLRRQSDASLIRKQIVQGKLAEYAVYLMFDKRCKAPDLTVYDKLKKSFDADLEFGNIRFHVKSQSKESEQRYSRSWVFQSEDPLFKENSSNDLCVFCVVDGDLVDICLIKKFKNIKFGDPKLIKFKGIKKMVYYEDNSCILD